jgi:hypothetical protein
MSATVLGGFWPENGVTTLTTAHTRSSWRRRAAMALSRKATLATQEIGLTLMGIAISGTPTAAKTLGRIAASSELGGVRTVEAETLINRATAASDVTDLNADLFTYNSYDGTPIANGDGNPLGVVH